MQRRYYVLKGGRVPHDVVTVTHRDHAVVLFYRTGGGFQHHMPPARFDATHRAVSEAEYTDAGIYAATFSLDDWIVGLAGYSRGHRWNGWACPLFPRESCEKIVAHLANGARYDEATDCYILPDENEEGEVNTYEPTVITVAGQKVKVWAIGSHSWIWDEEVADLDILKACEGPMRADGRVAQAHLEYPGFLHVQARDGRGLIVSRDDEEGRWVLDTYAPDKPMAEGFNPAETGFLDVPGNGLDPEALAGAILRLLD